MISATATYYSSGPERTSMPHVEIKFAQKDSNTVGALCSMWNKIQPHFLNFPDFTAVILIPRLYVW